MPKVMLINIGKFTFLTYFRHQFSTTLKHLKKMYIKFVILFSALILIRELAKANESLFLNTYIEIFYMVI